MLRQSLFVIYLTKREFSQRCFQYGLLADSAWKYIKFILFGNSSSLIIVRRSASEINFIEYFIRENSIKNSEGAINIAFGSRRINNVM